MSPEQAKAWMDVIDGQETFLLVLGCGAVNTLLVCAHIIGEGAFVQLVTITIGAYITGHTVGRFADK